MPDLRLMILLLATLIVSFLSFAFVGWAEALILKVSPIYTVTFVCDILIDVTGWFTVTLQEALRPFEVFTVIVAVPLLTALITPFCVTDTTSLSLVYHLSDLSVVSLGAIVALRVYDLPVSRVRAVLLSLTEVAGCSIVTLQVFLKPPSTVFTVIVTVPSLTGVTTPLCETLAIFSSLVYHLTALLLASEGLTVALRVSVFPI